MNPAKFSIAEATSNSSNGKTSMAKTVGGYLVLIGSLAFISGIVATFNISIPLERASLIITASAGIIAAGSALIGGKIIKPTEVKDEH